MRQLNITNNFTNALAKTGSMIFKNFKAAFYSAIVLLFLLLLASSVNAKVKKREIPDYDQRGKAPSSFGDVMLFLPRAIFYPVYLATDNLIRKPIGWAFSTAEKHRLPKKIHDFFTFGPNRQIGFLPSFFIDFGFRPSVGLSAFWRGFLHENNRLDLRTAYGGDDWVIVSLNDRLQFPNSQSALTINAEFNRRPDWIFHGIGSSTLKKDRGRYLQDLKQAKVSYQKDTFGDGYWRVGLGIRNATLSDGDSQTVTNLISQGAYPTPPAFNSESTIFLQRLDVAMGSRIARPKANVGGRFEFDFEHAFDLNHPQSRRWIKYGSTLAGFVNLFNHDRILSLSADIDMLQNLGDDGQVPFTELVQLGGTGPLPGFLDGRLLGESAVALTLAYNWSIWAFLDGTIHFAVGNVFDKNLQNFDVGLLRKSVGIGFRSPQKAGVGFSFLMAWGSKTFDAGGDFNEFRFLLGSSRGF